MEKIIAVRNYKGYKLIKASANIENALNMKLSITTERNSEYSFIDKVIEKLNMVIWDVKVERIFPDAINLEGNDLKDYIKEKLENHLREALEDRDLPFQEIELSDVDISKFNSTSTKVIHQLSFFNHMRIPEKTKAFVQEYVDKIEAIELTKAQLKGIYTQFAEPIEEVKEYVMYIGPNSKFKGAIGKIVGARDDEAPHLVEFPKVKDNGGSAKFWSKEENLIRFYI